MALIWEITLFHPIYEEPEAEKTMAGNKKKQKWKERNVVDCIAVCSCLATVGKKYLLRLCKRLLNAGPLSHDDLLYHS